MFGEIQITSKDFYLNQLSIPDKTSIEYEPFWENERKKLDVGVTIEGEFITPFLYWHLNYWNTEVNYKDDLGRNKQKFSAPHLRDNEWKIANAMWQAEREGKGLIILGCRRLGKSVFASSYIAMKASMNESSQNILAGTNAADIKLITDKMDKGLYAVPEYFRWTRIEDNWGKQVTLGVKERGGIRHAYSYIMIRNLDGGNNEEAIAGTKPESLLIDEIGKASWLKGFQAAIPGFTTEDGWLCAPILTGTGGDMDNFLDAKKAFTDPATYNFVEFVNPIDGRKSGLFLGHTFRQEAKVWSTLGDYVKAPEGSDLYKIEMQVSDVEKAHKYTLEKREQLAKSLDESALLKEIMYFPITEDEIFMTGNGNLFPLEATRKHLDWLKANKITGQNIWLYKDHEGVVRHKYAEPHETPITEWPTPRTVNKNAPIQVWEMPIPNPPRGLYVGGTDPYNQSLSYFSDSLGVCVIFKRMLDITTDEYVNTIVAVYAARPKTMEEWHDNVYMLLKFYNAICFTENEASTFIQYFSTKNESHMLADGIDYLKEFNPGTTTVNRPKGAAATPKNINHMMAELYEYTREEIVVGQDSEGNNIKKLGVTRIPDVMVLEEMLGFRPTENGKKGTNSDRIVAFRHALSYANYLDKYQPIIKIQKKEVIEEDYGIVRSPFSIGRSNPFSLGRNPFQ